jgi:formamidopyrimidine-DNA glycosylase
MPELPEVETVRRGLERLIVGETITNVEHDWPKSFPNAPTDVKQFLEGAKIVSVRRRAKVLLIELDSSYSLVIHLKMTGQLVFVANSKYEKRNKKNENVAELRFGAGHPNDSLIGELPDRSTRVIFTFIDGSHLYFNDQRKFGWIRLLPTVQVPEIDFFQKVGPEPLADDFLSRDFIARIRRRANTSIKATLLDQTVIAGVGNIYADESLWGARIHPASKVLDISDEQLEILYSELRYVLNLSIEKGGSTDRNYVNARGNGAVISILHVCFVARTFHAHAVRQP